MLGAVVVVRDPIERLQNEEPLGIGQRRAGWQAQSRRGPAMEHLQVVRQVRRHRFTGHPG